MLEFCPRKKRNFYKDLDFKEEATGKQVSGICARVVSIFFAIFVFRYG
jgi:hypothetical protein